MDPIRPQSAAEAASVAQLGALLEVTINQRKPAEDLHGCDDLSLQPKSGEALDSAIIGIAIIAIGSCALVMTTPAHATQVVPRYVEFTNDNVEQGGKPQVCVVTATITNPPEPEVVDFQFMVFINGRFGFKVTAGDMNWSNMSLVAEQIADANFFTAAFNHPNAFDKEITTEGQLVAFLVDKNLSFDFLDAFFGGNFSIRFRRTDINDERIYEIGQQPGPDIAAGFKACLELMK